MKNSSISKCKELNRSDNYWNRFGIRGLRYIFVFLFSVMQLTTSSCMHATNNWKSLKYEISHEKKNWTHEALTRKYFGTMKYPRERNLEPRNA